MTPAQAAAVVKEVRDAQMPGKDRDALTLAVEAMELLSWQDEMKAEVVWIASIQQFRLVLWNHEDGKDYARFDGTSPLDVLRKAREAEKGEV